MDIQIAPFAAMRDDIPASQLDPGVWALAQNAIAVNGSPSSPVKIRPGTPLLSSTAFGQHPCQGLFAWKGSSGLGTMASGSKTLTLADMPAIAAGDAIVVSTAGSADGTADLYTTVSAIGSWTAATAAGTVTVADACANTDGVSGVNVLDPVVIHAIYAGTSHLYLSDNPATALTVNLIGGLGMGAWAAGNLFQFAYANGQVYMVNGLHAGYQTNWRYTETGLWPMGCKAPTVAPTGTADGAGVLTGNYGYVFTYRDPLGDRESDPSPPLWFVDNPTPTTDQTVALIFRDATHPLGIQTNFKYSSGQWTKETSPGSGVYAAGGFGRNTVSKLNAMVLEVNPSNMAFTGNQAKVTAAACPDATFSMIRWYRTEADGDKFFFDAEVAPGDYVDTMADASLDNLNEVGDAGEDKDTIGDVAACIFTMSDGRVVLANFGPGRQREIAAAYSEAYPESFPASGFTNAGEENGAEILCGVPLWNRACVVCSDSIWVLDPTCTECKQSDDTVGGVGRWCAQGTPYGVFFVGLQGIYFFDGNRVRCISHCIDGTWASVQKARLPWVATSYDSTMEHFLAAVTLTVGGTQNDTIIALDCRTLGSDAGPRFSLWPMTAEAMTLLRERDTTWGKGSLVCQGSGNVARFDDADTYRSDGAGAAIPFLMVSGGLSHLAKDNARDFKHWKLWDEVYTEIEAL